MDRTDITTFTEALDVFMKSHTSIATDAEWDNSIKASYEIGQWILKARYTNGESIMALCILLTFFMDTFNKKLGDD